MSSVCGGDFTDFVDNICSSNHNNAMTSTNPFDSSDDEKESLRVPAAPTVPPLASDTSQGQAEATPQEGESGHNGATARAPKSRASSKSSSPKSPAPTERKIMNPFASPKKDVQASEKSPAGRKKPIKMIGNLIKKKKKAGSNHTNSSNNPSASDDENEEKKDPREERTAAATSTLEEDKPPKKDKKKKCSKKGDNHQKSEEDLDQALENLDLDKDFLNDSTDDLDNLIHDDSDEADDKLVSSETAATNNNVANINEMMMAEDRGIEYWKERVGRTEVYSHKYKPYAEEKQELHDLQASLGSNSSSSDESSIFWTFFGTTSGATAADTTTMDQSRHKAVKELFVGIDDGMSNMLSSDSTPASIILKRGLVSLAGKSAEVVLLTHGMLLLHVEEQKSMMGRSSLKKTLVHAATWDSVAFVGPLPEDANMSWRIMFKSGYRGAPLEFRCGSTEQQSAWLEALEMIIVHHHLHKKSATNELGWQYKYIHKPAFTLAVEGVDGGLPLVPRDLNVVDEYNEYTALHYAVRLNKIKAAERLLEAGASINTKDGDDHTAMYYALRDDAPEEMTQLLEKHGAQAKKKNKEWKATEELFGKVRATEENTARKKEEEERQKAAAAQAQMSKNMQLMNERGQKIEEMDDKARHLNQEAQNYASMAKQLKEKSKRGGGGKPKWLPF